MQGHAGRRWWIAFRLLVSDGGNLAGRCLPASAAKRRARAIRESAWALGTIIVAAVVVLFSPPGCVRSRQAAGPPNILLISIDTLRRDHLGCYGYRRATTPCIDKLARRGVLYERPNSTSSWTLPAHTSLLTGLYPAFHGVQDDGVSLPEEIPTLAGNLKSDGYRTLAVVSHLYVSSRFGLNRGFDVFDDELIDGGVRNPVAAEVVDRALARMPSAESAEPWFAFLHFFDPHWDYSPPPPFDRRFTVPSYRGPIDGTMRSMTPYLVPGRRMGAADLQHLIDLYDGEIAYVDAQIGRLLDELDSRHLLENTVIVLTGDHGEEFKEHGLLGHGQTLYAEQLRVPLIIAGPTGLPEGAHSRETVSLVDLAPTLLALAGAEPLPETAGVSLLKREQLPDRVVFSESIRFGNEMRCARVGPYKMIHYLQGDRRFFFDLRADPGEQRPLPGDPSDAELSEALGEYALAADGGWHLKLISLSGRPLECRGVLRTTGRFVDPRRYFSGNLRGPSEAVFSDFRLDESGSELTFDVNLRKLMGEITFETEPADAPVVFDVEVEEEGESAGVGADFVGLDGELRDPGLYLGKGTPLPEGEPVKLTSDDSRAKGVPDDYLRASDGCYIRAVPQAQARPLPELAPEARARLRSLGYVD